MVMGKVAVARRERLHCLCKRIVTYPRSAAGTRGALVQATRRYVKSEYGDLTEEEALRRLYEDQSEIGDLVRRAVATLTDATTNRDDDRGRDDEDDADLDDVDASDDRDDRDDDAATSDLQISQLADLLIEAERFSTRAEALSWLLHHPNGHALVRTHKAEKELPMTPSEHIQKAVQDLGPIRVCKDIIGMGSSPVSEHELVAALTKAASEQHPELTEAQAFAKLYAEPDVWRACAVAAKAMPVTPTMVGGVDATHEAIDSTESSEAYEQLTRMAEKMRAAAPELSAAQAFDRVFTDKRNASLAAKAHVTPSPTTFFPMPR
jgi:hypothetical protein